MMFILEVPVDIWVGSGNGLVPNIGQGIVWTYIEQHFRLHVASVGYNAAIL